jgi:ABC-type glycerol-3-phosphate transport system substrate-binding protein
MRLILLMILILLAGCGGEDESSSEPTATRTAPSPTFTPLPVAQNTPLPTDEATPPEMVSLRIWWPEPLAPLDRPEVTELLNQLISDFATDQEGRVDVDFRLKGYSDPGGVMATLRSAVAVAPDALPDLTLIRREDLVVAAQSGLIYPLEGLISSTIIGDLYDSALALGTVNGQVYGLPLALDVLQLAYYPPQDEGWSFDDMLSRERQLVFPAGRVSGINSIFFLQYLDAGGSPPDNGTLSLNENALLQVLRFYEAARDQGVVSPDVLEYATINAYLADLTVGDIEMALINSNTYFDMRSDGRELLTAPIPSASGEPITLVNGWMWVMSTDNGERQALVREFLIWMMESDNQREYAETVRMLPSQRTVLKDMDGEAIDVALMDAMLMNARIPQPENANGALVRAMQNALISVITGERSAEEATQLVVDLTEN